MALAARVLIIFFILLVIYFLQSLSFYFLLARKIKFTEALKISCTATAINRLFFTGSGYLAASYFSKTRNLIFHEVFAAFLVLEFFSILPLLIAGIYFGVTIAVKLPVIFLLFALALAFLLAKGKSKVSATLQNLLKSLRDTGLRIFKILPFVILNSALIVFYYLRLFEIFNFKVTAMQALKIVSVPFAAGYLSPVPAGFGFKDSGLILLLHKYGAAFNHAFLIAFWDRLITTLFMVILGCLMGFDLIKEAAIKRFSKKKEE